MNLSPKVYHSRRITNLYLQHACFLLNWQTWLHKTKTSMGMGSVMWNENNMPQLQFMWKGHAMRGSKFTHPWRSAAWTWPLFPSRSRPDTGTVHYRSAGQPPPGYRQWHWNRLWQQHWHDIDITNDMTYTVDVKLTLSMTYEINIHKDNERQWNEHWQWHTGIYIMPICCRVCSHMNKHTFA